VSQGKSKIKRRQVMNFTKDFFENYKVEDLVLHNELVSVYGGTAQRAIIQFSNDVIEDSVKSLSEDEKMEVMDYILPSFSNTLVPLICAFREDDGKGVIKHTRYSYNHQSLKSWRKSHSLVYDYMDTDTMLGLKNNSVYTRFHYYLKLTSSNDDIKRFIDSFICDKIYTLLRDEIQYFHDHDEYEQEAKKLTNRNIYPDFNNNYYSYSHDDNKVHKKNSDTKIDFVMSLEEVKKTNTFLDSLDNEINMLVFNRFEEFQGFN
jgi:hypothetical protein